MDVANLASLLAVVTSSEHHFIVARLCLHCHLHGCSLHCLHRLHRLPPILRLHGLLHRCPLHRLHGFHCFHSGLCFLGCRTRLHGLHRFHWRHAEGRLAKPASEDDNTFETNGSWIDGSWIYFQQHLFLWSGFRKRRPAWQPSSVLLLLLLPWHSKVP
jgi:hypothetical protein